MGNCKLKACPFCGGEARITEFERIDNYKYYAACKNRRCRVTSDVYRTKAEATAAWNRRISND